MLAAMSGRDDEDEDELRERGDEDPANGERWEAAQEGAELLREGDVAGAVRELEALIAREPSNEYGFFFLGAAHFEGGRFDKAMKAYLSAATLAPAYVGALAGLGHSLRMLGKHDEALRVAKQTLLRDKNDPEGLYLAGLAHYARGEGAAALQYLERYLATRPELESQNEAMGLLEVLRGQFQQLDPDES